MKNFFCSILYISFLSVYSQTKNIEWASGKIFMRDGHSKSAKIALNNDFFEGTLLVKEGEKIISLSPLQVDRFFVFRDQDTVSFLSIETRFLERQGQKKSFAQKQ